METPRPLHPESQALVDFVAKLNVKPYYEMDDAVAARTRSKLVGTNVAVAGDVKYDGSRKELFVPLPDFTGTSNTIKPPIGSTIKPAGAAERREKCIGHTRGKRGIHGLFVPGTIRTIDGLFVPYPGLFIPWTVRTLLDYSYHGPFARRSEFSSLVLDHCACLCRLDAPSK